jgi:hypothetical protein
MPSMQKFFFAFLWSKACNALAARFGALVPIYGTLGNLADCANYYGAT